MKTKIKKIYIDFKNCIKNKILEVSLLLVFFITNIKGTLKI